ncbi:MAG: hypothetical protein K2N89_05560 [Lachnospiraceae bacterium]|nr:hypothetical protein [Lachnospiraceae bacterium]
MDFNQQAFAASLEQLKETARLQKNVLTEEQIREAFEKWQLDESQFALIYDYLNKNHIGIDAPIEEETLSSEDGNFLDMYLGELKELPHVTDGEKRAVTMSALAGDKDAQAKLVEIYLPNVVEISRLYAGQGVLVEDLIGEGNVALSMAVTMLACVEEIDEVEGFLVKMIMDAMEEHIGNDSDSRKIDEDVLNQVNEVNDKAKELYESLLRKVSAKEVADELGISEDKVNEALEFSANRIDYIESK